MNIPRDIWLYLGQFIPDGDLRRLITLNSAFLELGLNARYQDINLDVLEERTITYLVRLMDPAIAKRVRSFSIEPYIGFDQDRSNITAAGNHDRPSLWKKGVDVFRKRFRISKKPGRQDESVEQYPSTLGGLEQALTDAVSGWSNLREFSVKWWDSTELRQLESFLLPAWSTFGPNLRKVTLEGHPASIRTLLSSAERLPSLRELHFELADSIHRVDDIANAAALEDVIAPFINSVSATLEVLSISSWEGPLDLSQFFLKLGIFPGLRHFKVEAPFDQAFLNTPDGLTRLLRDHSHTLTSIRLQLRPSRYISFMDRLPAVSYQGWMESMKSEPCILTNLTTLEMYPGNSDPFGLINMYASNTIPAPEPTAFAIFLGLLARSTDTLTELAVQGRFLYPDQVESILSTFASKPPPLCLTVLCLHVYTLDLRLLHLIAQELPCLRKLSLYALKTKWTKYISGCDKANLDDLQNALRDRVYADWKLQEIWIRVCGRTIDRGIMELIVRSIPSLRDSDSRGLEDL